MTDNEIIKAMQCVIGNEVLCSECTYQKVLPFPSCRMMCAKNALDLINRQKAEIERLQKKANTPFAKITFDRDKLQEIVDEYVKNIEIDINMAKSEAIKEFAERLKEKCYEDFQETYEMLSPYVTDDDIDNLVKEMTEVNENEMPDMRK